MSLHLFSLSNELLIEVISNLGPLDTYTCLCTCRKLNELIVNSQLIQYIMRTALSGVFDPLEPGISLPDRLDALERWETAWREMDIRKPIASIDSLFHAVGGLPSRCFGEQHIVAFCTGFDVPASYSFLNLHTWSSSTPDVARWTAVEINDPNVLSFAFAPELDLSVAFLYVKQLLSHRVYSIRIT
jgi:F-box associated protein